MKTRFFTLLSASVFSIFLFTNCKSDPDGTDSFKRSMRDGNEKLDRNKADSSDYEKNYPGDSI